MYQLKKGTEIIDIESEGGLVITANQPLNYQYGRASKTYTIKITNNGRNNMLLDNLFNKNFNKTLKFDGCYLNVDGINLGGTLLIYGYNEYYANTQFVISAGQLWLSLGEKNIREDFDWSSLDLEQTLAAVKLDPADNGFDLCYRGNGFYHYKHKYLMQDFDICEFQPIARLKYILNTIFADYDLDISTNIISSEDLNKLYTAFQFKGRNSSEWFSENESEVLYDSNSEFSGLTIFGDNIFTVNEFHFPGGFLLDSEGDTLTDLDKFTLENFELSETTTERLVFTATEKGAYRFSAKVNMQLFIAEAGDPPRNFTGRTFSLQIRKYDTSDNLIDTLVAANKGFGNGTEIDEIFDLEIDTRTIPMNEGEKLVFFAVYQNAADGEPIQQQINYQIRTNTIIKLDPFAGFGAGETIAGKYCVPDLNVKDFVRSVLELWNAEIYVSVERKLIYIQNRQQENPDNYDITKLIIKDTVQATETPEPDNFLLKYKRDSSDKYFEQGITEFLKDDGTFFIENNSNQTTQKTISFADFHLDPRWNEFPARLVVDYETDTKFSIAFNDIVLLKKADNKDWWFNLYYGKHAELAAGIENNSGFSLRRFEKYKSIQEIYNEFYKDTADLIKEGNVLQCELIVDEGFLQNLYYLQGQDLRANYIITVPGFEGIYQCVELRKIKGQIYRGMFFRQ